MTNIIEIVVKGTNLAKTTFDEVKRDAQQMGQQTGDDFTKGVKAKVEDALPPVVDDSFKKTKEPARKSGDDAALAFTQAFGGKLPDRVQSIAAGGGRIAGNTFSASFSEAALKGRTESALMGVLGPSGVEALAKAEGDRSGFNFTDAMGGRIRQDLPDKVEKPLEDSGRKGGQKAGAGAAGALSPLLIGAFAAAATAGPGLILAATATAVLGAGALITKSNAGLQSSYQALGRDASDMIETATAPLIPALQGAVTVLDQGLGRTGNELKAVFAAVAPDATAITSGLVSLVDNALPGMATGLRAIAPYAGQIADDFGKLGSGLGGLFSGLAGGASGGMAGFSALIDLASHLLTDIGQITGALAGGLGPALHDIDTVAVPVAGALTAVVKAIPPGAVRGAADAVAVLFAAFQIGKIAGVVQEGQTFLQFLGVTKTETKAAAAEVEALGAAEEAAAVKTGLASKAMGGLSGAAGLALGPLGMIIGGAGLLGNELDNLYKSSHDTAPPVDDLATAMENAAQGSGAAQDGVTKFAQALAAAPFDLGAKSIGNMDAALIKLQASDPAGAATEFYQLQQALEAQGKSADDVAKMFPQYTAAVKDAQLQAKLAASSTGVLSGSVDVLTQKLTAANMSTQDSARQSAAATLAALGFSDGESALATSLDITLQAFTEDSGAASAYKTVLDALYGKYQSYSDAQAAFTTGLADASKQLKVSKDGFDTNTAAGAANYKIMSSLATENETRAEALLKETGNQQQANKALQAGAVQIDNMAKSAHFTQAQIDALNIALYGTKNIGDISVPISADTSAAYNAVSRVINWIGAQTAYIQVQTVGGMPGGKQLLAHGGVVGGIGTAATGGARGALTVINEQGPELVRLPSGSTVFSNPDSQRMMQHALGGGGGWDGTVRLIWDGPADGLFKLIREHVRAVAGNGPNSVQTALGQN